MACLLPLAWGPTASGASAKDSARGLVATSGYVETTYDRVGNVTGVRAGSGSTQPYVNSGTVRGADFGVMPLINETGTYSGGCRKVDWYESLHSWLGTLLARFHQVKSWCWSYPAVTSVNVGTYVSDVACCVQYAGLVAAFGWYYTWSGSSHGGHYSFREGKFTNCLFKYGCTGGEAYPWVEIYVNGNGAWIAYDGH